MQAYSIVRMQAHCAVSPQANRQYECHMVRNRLGFVVSFPRHLAEERNDRIDGIARTGESAETILSGRRHQEAAFTGPRGEIHPVQRFQTPLQATAHPYGSQNRCRLNARVRRLQSSADPDALFGCDR